ncbi:MAG: TDP-N-acetylfucosamine:lipid II N-acetylfucosaminyltransferase, partial [Clostridia bacterium]|nr:TDP-N-acetylfucosamine:lipid II N-acetylfucosaminyltransferase [Clostridia bacterium]
MNTENVFYVDHYFRVFTDKACLKHLRQADKVIFSGVFTPCVFFVRLLSHPLILRKFYFHFWGGDFYHTPMKYAWGDLRGNAKTAARKLAYRFSAGLIFLIPGEYEKFREITGVRHRHLLAPIPLDPRNKPWHEYISPSDHPGETRILLGNSANPSNCHEQGLKLLKAYANENIRIICPLSYGGPQEYAEKTAALGKELFGAKFVPLM